MATLQITLTFPDGALAKATTTADFPTGDAAIKYEGVYERLPRELISEEAWPSLLGYHWKAYAKKTGLTFNSQMTGEWLPEDDLKPEP